MQKETFFRNRSYVFTRNDGTVANNIRKIKEIRNKAAAEPVHILIESIKLCTAQNGPSILAAEPAPTTNPI